jgi:hypothetical protein
MCNGLRAVFPRQFATAFTEMFGKGTIAQDTFDGGSDVIRLAAIHQQAADPIIDRLDYASGASADHWLTAGIRFAEDQAKTFGVSVRHGPIRHEEQIAQAQVAQQIDIRHFADQRDRVAYMPSLAISCSSSARISPSPTIR